MMCPYMKTIDGFEMHIGVNHLGKTSLKSLGLKKERVPERFIVWVKSLKYFFFFVFHTSAKSGKNALRQLTVTNLLLS